MCTWPCKYVLNDSTYYDYGIKCVENDIIEMYLDLEELILKYSVNGKDQGILTDDIEEGDYSLAVTLYDGCCKIELLDSS